MLDDDGVANEEVASNASFSSSSSNGGDKRRNILRFSSNLQTWASEYPFPVFKPSRKQRHNKAATTSSVVHVVYDNDEDDEDTSATAKVDASSSDEEDGPISVLAPHPLSSDATIDHHRTSWAAHASRFAPPARLERVASFRGQPIEDDSTPPVGREEVSTLLATVCGPNSGVSSTASRQLASLVDATHVDIRWLASVQPKPPSCHLHLGNLHLRLDEQMTGNTTLINSPRSALVLFRKGVPLPSVLRRPWAQKRFTHKASFGALDTLTLTERREYVLEELRRRRLEEVLLEYEKMCRVTRPDDIVELAAEVMKDQQKLSAMYRVRPTSSVSKASHPSVRGQVTDVAATRPGTALSTLKRRLEEARSVSEQTMYDSPLMVRSRLLQSKAGSTLHKIAVREATTEALLKEKEAQRKEKVVLAHGRNFLVREQQRTTTSAHAYRRIVLDQHNTRREDEASRYREAMYTCSVELSEAHRASHLVRDRMYGTDSRNSSSML
ncbi:Hypothetical protein, putative [Bodo saltans]|uniref:Uncharacterized protein n=1 Tax=Bodo saltans TaxID=75058 RepID=A0A0S4JAL7_BODSA|nr:Hypothetical protein, putative [Bodo saltans]|eukprot:CUG88609.1 Hypothetical protein, putative [Bodo saltans]